MGINENCSFSIFWNPSPTISCGKGRAKPGALGFRVRAKFFADLAKFWDHLH